MYSKNKFTKTYMKFSSLCTFEILSKEIPLRYLELAGLNTPQISLPYKRIGFIVWLNVYMLV